MDAQYLRLLTNLLATHVAPKRIYLFGSWARGDDSEDSDIDLLIVKETDLPRYERAHSIREIIDPYPYPIDLLVYTPDEFEEEKNIVGTIPYAVAKEGVLLYG